MAIQLPQVTNPYDLENPVTDAYGYIAMVALNLGTDTGSLSLLVNHSSSAAKNGSVPLDQIDARLGEVFVYADSTVDPPIAEQRFKTLDEFMQDQEFAWAFSVIAQKLYTELLAKHPKLVGAIQVPTT